MGLLKIVECRGFTKEQAFAGLNFDPNCPVIPGTNATQAWNRAGCPIIGSQDFKRFAVQQLEEKTKNEPGFGLHIVLDPPIKDIRRRPYSVINNKTVGTRKWKLVYGVREDRLDISSLPESVKNEDGDWEVTDTEIMEISVIEPGLIIEICDSKALALEKMKELIVQTHKSYSIIPMKVPNIAPIAAFGVYTPSSRAKEGTFVAWGINRPEIE